MNVEEEVERLKEEIQRLGKIQPDGSYKIPEAHITLQRFAGIELQLIHLEHIKGRSLVTFGVLFHDDRCANIFEALVGTLRAAKKRKFLTYDGELLLQGVHDNVEITLKPPPQPLAVAAAAES